MSLVPELLVVLSAVDEVSVVKGAVEVILVLVNVVAVEIEFVVLVTVANVIISGSEVDAEIGGYGRKSAIPATPDEFNVPVIW